MRKETCGHVSAFIRAPELSPLLLCSLCYLEALEGRGYAVPWERVLSQVVNGTTKGGSWDAN